jgi:hypothetical protein
MGYKFDAIGNILGNTLVPTKEHQKNKNRPQKNPKEKNWTLLGAC